MDTKVNCIFNKYAISYYATTPTTTVISSILPPWRGPLLYQKKKKKKKKRGRWGKGKNVEAEQQRSYNIL
jgi:hypothetical protein